MKWDDAVAVVVGGTGGLGEATVRRLSAAGATVVVADIAEDEGAAIADELGDGCHFVATDVSDSEALAAALAHAGSLGTVRAVVDVHGGPASGGRIVNRDGEPLDMAGFETTLRFYLTSVFDVMRQAAATMQANEPDENGVRGAIVVTSSIAAYEGQIGQLPYAAAKGGVASMVLVAARDLAASGIRVVGVAPGTFLTPAYGPMAEQVAEHWAGQVPFPARMGEPEEYASLVEHLCTNDYLNGEVIRIDGALRFPPK